MLFTKESWRRGAFAVAMAMGLAALPVVASAEQGADHPEVARFPGARINNYDYKEYEEFQLILAKPQRAPGGAFTAAKLMPLEGKVTYIHYEMPKSVSPLQVFRNYQSSLRRSGFSDLFTCDRPCTTENLSNFQSLMKARQLYLNYSTDNQYLAAQRNNTYVSLWVNEGGAFLFVVEKEKLDDGLMAVTGEGPIAKALGTDGKVDLYGFQFDTGKAVLRDGSKPTLQELGRVLQDNPGLNVEVVGHTDDVGGADGNQRLSEARAAAVAEALNRSYGIAAPRLKTRGMGQTVPLAANTTEAGRAQNRRVEIIAQLPATPVVAPATRPAPAAPAQTANTTAQQPAPAPAQEAPKTRNLMDDANKAMEAAGKLKNLFGL
ncbi:OmpA family protein [Rhodoferax sp. TBRC 17660]|uniref:OmpA family protein n=1 Tax=Rhodoferax potami TaxID=3068338 RepID=A0ABU3KLF5_9BURK|nr:OmpA family protein [Rhodoferax sp. TBRC 17660]MDT7518581.1 OmpA family protein [Rhodoferax sp. TBRC 17660]